MHFPVRRHCALFLAAAISVAACGPEQPHGGHGVFGLHHGFRGIGLAMHAARLGMRGVRPRGLRQACADDVARLCPDAKTRRDERACLTAKQTSLSAECRDALARRREQQR